ncbi:MAG: hypothetical protein K9N06_08855 [Candidatus Cloacimonetes bacterium]|nr:hypothetical protein [Candidatus Cloacimonadota bacterium]
MKKHLSILFLPVFLFLTLSAFSEETTSALSLERTDTFYDSLKAVSERNWLLKPLYVSLFSADSLDAVIQVEDSTYESWRGKVIQTINIFNQDVFSVENNEWQIPAYNLVAGIGNGVHRNTREWVVRNNLFFHEGDYFVPETLRFNLIYLRKLDYLSEAIIVVVDSPDAVDAVDIYVVIRDKFAINPGGHFKSLSRFNLTIDDQNFLGWGRQLRNTWHIDPENQGSVGWESLYKIPNIYGTFIGAEFNWADLPGYTWKSATLNRPFLYPIKIVAGGAEIGETWVRPPRDSIAVDKIELGGWSGYCFHGKSLPAIQYSYVALALDKTWFRKRPEVSPDSGKLWHENILTVGSLAITQSDYRSLPYVYSLLKNKDIPVGYIYEIHFGKEFSEFRNRSFLGIHGAWGNVLANGGYLYLKGGIESYIYHDATEQGVFLLEPLYITPLRTIGKVITRTFYRGRIILGFERFPGETLLLSTDPYFRGNLDMTGRQLVALGMEKDYLAPWLVLGFNVTIFGFIDGALITNALFSPPDEHLLFTEGLGFRLHNVRLIWKSVEFHIAWNQRMGHFGTPSFALTVKAPLILEDFEGRKPSPYFFR